MKKVRHQVRHSGPVKLLIIGAVSASVWAGQVSNEKVQPTERTRDSGVAFNVVINGPSKITLDSADNLYVYETNDTGLRDVIRKVDAKSHVITTLSVLGCGLGNKSTARCFGPIGQLVMGGLSNLLFSEFAQGRLRQLDVLALTISTVAGNGQRDGKGDGGPAVQASIEGPRCFTTDRGGNIFLCDASHRIRRIDAKTHIITTVAGDGRPGEGGDHGPAIAAQVDPIGIAVGPGGDIYVATIATTPRKGIGTFAPSGYRIRRIDAQTGIIETIAGNGAEVVDGSGFTGDGQLALETELYQPRALTLGHSDDLFFLNGDARIAVIDLKSRRIFSVAGNGQHGATGDGGPATRATIAAFDLAIDSRDDLFIADWQHNRVRRIDSETGTISTYAGNGLPGNKPATWH